MNRRDALRLLATGAALQLAPGNLLAALREARALLATQTTVRTLDLHQHATVTAIAELIIPRTDPPGATAGGGTGFIDLIGTGWDDAEGRAHFLNGLADVDVRTQALFGRNFVDSSPGQQAQILAVLGQQMTEEADALQKHPRQYRDSPLEPNKNFYYMVRGLTLMGYYTSEAGASRELDFQIIPGRFDACVDARASREERENKW